MTNELQGYCVRYSAFTESNAQCLGVILNAETREDLDSFKNYLEHTKQNENCACMNMKHIILV